MDTVSDDYRYTETETETEIKTIRKTEREILEHRSEKKGRPGSNVGALPSELVPIEKAIALLRADNDPDCQMVGAEMARLYASSSRLSARGGASLVHSSALAERNRLICALWQKHERWRDLRPGAVARAMLRAYRQYETRRWPQESRSLSAPTQEPEATFWRLLRGEHSMPGSAKQMKRILESD
ncbi:hypothetical protein [Mesorhizobium sp. ISC11]|uniref:hypothetical protein n=1 Tax=Mesorhizobium sp. ISC11 TaxID=3076428 RepID=UPI00301D7D8A